MKKELGSIKKDLKTLASRPRSNRARRRKPGRGAEAFKGYSSRRVPASIGTEVKSTQPQFTGVKSGCMTVRHTEFVIRMPGSEDLNMATFRVNPSDQLTFPWLYYLAQGFEKFEVKKMVVHYVPVSSTQEKGSIYMYPEYNVNDGVLQDINSIMNMQGVVTGSVWSPHFMVVDCKRFNQLKSYLIRNPYSLPENYLMYDPVNINVGVSGTGDLSVIGQVYIEYEIELQVVSTDEKLNLDFGITNFNAMFVDTGDGYYPPDLQNGTITPLLGNWNWNFVNTCGIQFTKAWVGICVFSISVTNGFDSSRPLVWQIAGDITYNGVNDQDMQDTVFAGSDAIIAWIVIKVGPKGGILKPNGKYLDGTGGPAGGWICLYPCTNTWWASPDPNSLPPTLRQMLESKKKEPIFRDVLPNKHLDEDDQSEETLQPVISKNIVVRKHKK